MAKVTGKVSQFGSKGYGFIDGDDDERYFVHQKNIETKSRLKTGTRVVFDAQTSDKGLVAMEVVLENGESSASTTKTKSRTKAKPMSNGTIKTLFTALFIMQAIVIYQVFFSA